MGPADISDMTSTTSSNQTLTIPKLRADSSNWATYQERILNYLTSKSLKRHVLGTARKPAEIEVKDDGSVHKKGSSTALTEDELEKYEEEVETYEQKQASVREVIYRTVDKSTFLQVKNEPDAAAVWKKLISIHADKGSMYETNLLAQLQNTRFAEGGNMREHLTSMTEIKERLAEMGCPISDEMFMSCIRTSLSLVPSYRSLFITLSASAHKAKEKLSSADVIWHLNNEASAISIEDSINKSNAAMTAASTGTKRGRKGKSKRDEKHCTNCDKPGHTKDQCYAPGGGKEKEAPEWYRKRQKKEKEASSSANAAEKSETSDENYAMLAFIDEPSTALSITSDFQAEAKAEAHLVSQKSRGVIIDCGASNHFTPDRHKLLNYTEIQPEPIRAADGRMFSALGKGDLKINLPNGGEKATPITLKNVFYSPSMAFTLMSVPIMDRGGYFTHMESGICAIGTTKPTRKVIGCVPLIRGLYRVIDTTDSSLTPVANIASRTMTINELHRKMGHINHDDLKKMVRERMVTGIELNADSKPEFCEVCVRAKAPCQPFPKKSLTQVKGYGDKIVADLWGPAPVESLGRKKYYSLYQDLYSHEEYVNFLRLKSEAFRSYKEYEAWVKVQREAVIKIFGCDRGGEFNSKEFDEHLKSVGTVRHLTVHDSPSLNGAAERANRTHVECARAMMIAAGLPKSLWGEAIRHSVWLRNRAPTRALPWLKTPIEVATGNKPDLSLLREWGATAWVRQLDTGKLDPRAEEGRFVGFDEESKGYRISQFRHSSGNRNAKRRPQRHQNSRHHRKYAKRDP